MRFTRDVCLRFDQALGRIWLETDGRGGFAASSLLSCATSRFHGLLVAPFGDEGVRHLFLSRFEETFHGDGREFPISTARYGGAFAPGGHRFVDECSFDGHPSFTYRIGHVVVTRDVMMVRDAQVVLVRYRATGQRIPITLRLRPFVPYRRADSLTFANEALDQRVAGLDSGIALQPYTGMPRLAITLSRGEGFDADPQWYRGVEFTDDAARGYESHEDQWSPGELYVHLASDETVVVAATIGRVVEDPLSLWAAEESRREMRAERATGDLNGPPVRVALELAADDFLYRTSDGRPGVIAGYPWFGEWGRDTLIALPGLTLARGLVEPCGDVLAGLVPYLKDGRLPNVFGTSREASDYRAVDPAMWFGRAVRLYADAGGSQERLVDVLLPALLDIATAHCAAHGPALSCDESGLLCVGTPDVATTWMDAVVDGRPITPRHGFQVEVNALWFVLLDTLVRLLESAGRRKDARAWTEFRDRVGDAFAPRFWIAGKNRLADRVTDGVQDDSVRPNMVIAAALDPSPLTQAQRTAVVDLSRAELLTPFGLRTLSPRYLRYRGRFEGDQIRRDDAYHQGTVWPWLLGFHVEAALRARGRARPARDKLRKLLDAFEPHLAEHGIGHVSEVFDGDPPHRPGGCFAQAWSVAELLRAYALLDRGGSR